MLAEGIAHPDLGDTLTEGIYSVEVRDASGFGVAGSRYSNKTSRILFLMVLVVSTQLLSANGLSPYRRQEGNY